MIKVCHVCGKEEEHAAWNSTTCNKCLEIGIKYCSKCGKVKLLEEFATKNGKVNGYCLECACKASSISHAARYASDDNARIEHNTKHNAYRRNRYAQDANYRQEALNRSHDRRYNTDSDLSGDDWNEILNLFNNSCAYCGSKESLSMDHVVPVSKGGKTTKGNIVPACIRCNSSKRNNDVTEWYTKQPFFDKDKLAKIISL